VLLAVQDGEVGGPQRFGVVGGARAGGVFFKKARELIERPGDSLAQDLSRGTRWGGRDYEVPHKWGESFPVRVILPEAGGARSGDGEASSIVMGTWSEPIEGREVSHPLMKGKSMGLANAKSITEGRALPERGNLVYMPGEFGWAKPPGTANSM